MHRATLVGIATSWFVALVLAPRPSLAFTFGEHHDIGVAALARIPEGHRRSSLATLDAAFGSTRTCRAGDVLPAAGRGDPSCIDLADLGALAADHACSVSALEDVIVREPWTLAVVRRAMRARRLLASGDSFGTSFGDSWRRSDLDLDLIDARYGARAASNDAHFALTRSTDTLRLYLHEALEIDRPPLNAVGLFAIFHTASLRLAIESRAPMAEEASRRLVATSILAEAFADHFLEDMFSTGHIVGTVGDVATKKGTHDLYGERGLDVRTWRGDSYEGHGDAFMKVEDRDRAAVAVATAMDQWAMALEGDPAIARSLSEMGLDVARRAASVDVCRESVMPDAVVPRSIWPTLEAVLVDSPVPARTTTLLPRGHADVGAFVGFASGARTLVVGALPTSPNGVLAAAEFELSGRFGVSLGDIVGPRADGRFYVEVGRVLGGDAMARASPAGESSPLTLRHGTKFGLYAPFFLIPGDLILLSPVLGIASPKTLEAMAITAAYGGLVPWQRPVLTRFGDVQFLAGRKIDVYLYDRHDVVELPGEPRVTYRSLMLGTPLVEWRSSNRMTSTTGLGVAMRFSAGADIPFGAVNPVDASTATRLYSAFYGALQLEFWARTFL
ncbi:MAG: hypothetical protein U0169_11115 [Polyangiaceae bacterium]